MQPVSIGQISISRVEEMIWTISPRLRYAQHDSNVSLYEFDRWEASVYLRRGFR